MKDKDFAPSRVGDGPGMPRDNCPQCERLKAEREKVKGELREAEAREVKAQDEARMIGDCYNDARDYIKRLEKALRLTQWAGSDSRGYYCIECGNDKEEGHDRGCIVGQALYGEGSGK